MRKRFLCFSLLFFLCAPASGNDPGDANAAADRTYSNGKTALMAAARNGDNERIKALLENGADVNERNNNGGTPIMYAALSGQPRTVSLLIENHANVDAVAGNGWTALMIASVKGYVDVAGLLLRHGADPNQGDVYAWTPLMRAAYENRPGIVELLATRDNTRVNQRGENGVTALHLAVLQGNVDIVKLLLAQGADPEIKDNSDRTPLDFAKQNNDLNLLHLMGAGLNR